ncbi:MAG: sulfite exporter TauE/SafE family protein [Acetobacteraceae bacterium]|nr:sulfite exporter TauE/SafE family protein [Acetobacteraceae bacterium]
MRILANQAPALRLQAVDDPWPTLRWAVLIAATAACAVLGAFWTAPGSMTMAAMMVAIFAASVVSSVAGFAFSAIAGAMVFHLVANPIQAVQIMIVCSIANQAAMTWSLRRAVEWRTLSLFLAGGALGLPLGVALLLHADHAAYTAALGVFLVCYGTWMLVRPPITLRRQHPAFDLAVGVLGGITGGAAGFPGAAVTIWCGCKGWDKSRQRALFQPFILLMQVAALVAISVARPAHGYAVGLDAADLLCIPASLLGTALGMMLFQRLSDTQFTRAVNLLLIVSGISYVA